MSGGIYGGDEVGAVVFDAGHYTFRAGYAGEETPKADIPSTIGILQAVDEVKDDAMDVDGGDKAKRKRYNIDTNATFTPVPGMEMGTFLKDGMIEDWDAYEALLDFTYKRYILSTPELHPVLLSEPPWNVKSKREKVAELMLEKYEVPAFFIAKNAVLAAFASGRSTGLVIDSGASQTSATPVYDGYCYGQAAVKSALAGDALTRQCQLHLEKSGIELVPSYLVASKESTTDDEAPKWTRKAGPEPTKSFHSYMVSNLLRDFQASILQVSEVALVQEQAEKMPALSHEFPNGVGRDFIAERFALPESLFNTAYLKSTETSTLMTVPQVATTSIGMCDIDIKNALYNGVIVTGGNSLLQGFVERLTHELQAKCPSSVRLRVQAPPTPAERRYGAWIGGSILGSLGSFQQMWVSKQEWEETGKAILEKKCP